MAAAQNGGDTINSLMNPNNGFQPAAGKGMLTNPSNPGPPMDMNHPPPGSFTTSSGFVVTPQDIVNTGETVNTNNGLTVTKTAPAKSDATASNNGYSFTIPAGIDPTNATDKFVLDHFQKYISRAQAGDPGAQPTAENMQYWINAINQGGGPSSYWDSRMTPGDPSNGPSALGGVTPNGSNYNDLIYAMINNLMGSIGTPQQALSNFTISNNMGITPPSQTTLTPTSIMQTLMR